MAEPEANQPARKLWPPTVFLVASPLLGALVLAAVGYYPTLNRCGRIGLRSSWLAPGAVTMVAYATLLPAMLRMRRLPATHQRFAVAMQAGVKRFFLTLVIAYLGYRRQPDQTTFLFWIGMSYVVLTLIEAVVLAAWSKRLET